MQLNSEPNTATTYEITFVPQNPIPSQGSIQISWPQDVQVPDTVKCTVTTNRVWEEKCTIDTDKQIITIVDVFSESTAFQTKVTILMEGVINPKNNKEKGSGFLLTTYTDERQIYRIDKIPKQ